MPESLTTYKLAIKADYRPTLAVYSHMDAVAMSRAHDFPHWERGPLAIAIRNQDAHRSFSMTFNVCHFVCEFPPDVDQELSLATEVIGHALNKIQVNKLERVAIAQIFGASETDRSFDDLMLRVEKKFHVAFESVPAFNDLKLSDTTYIVSAKDKDNERWLRNIQVGPMTRNEWFTRFPIDLQAFNLERKSIESYKDELVPELFTFISIEASSIQGNRQQVIRNAPDVVRRSGQIAEGIMAFIEGQ